MIVDDSNIYVSSKSKKIKNISEKEGVNYLERNGYEIESELRIFAKNIKEDVIIWTNVTSPFIGEFEYKEMYKKFTSNSCNLLISALERKDYAFYNNRKINFKSEFVNRSNIKPINICTNGAYIFSREYIICLGC